MKGRREGEGRRGKEGTNANLVDSQGKDGDRVVLPHTTRRTQARVQYKGVRAARHSTSRARERRAETLREVRPHSSKGLYSRELRWHTAATRLLRGCAVTPRRGARRPSTFETPAARGRSARRPRRSPCAACHPSAPPAGWGLSAGCRLGGGWVSIGWRLGVDWVAVGWRLVDHAPGWPDRRAQQAGPAGGPSRRAQAGGAQAGPAAGGPRRAGPCSDRPCALPETKMSSTILGCTWLG